EALQLLNESGLEGVTLRKLASRLNVQAPALYWHFKNKKTLVNEMAEAILQTEFYDITERRADESWKDWLIQLFIYLSKALLSHTDGGRVVAGAHLSLAMANISETAISTLVGAEMKLRKSRMIFFTVVRLLLGNVVE